MALLAFLQVFKSNVWSVAGCLCGFNSPNEIVVLQVKEGLVEPEDSQEDHPVE
tara:strand:+ start:537 stop:695 length:159 start_codon:yes stop_codon:yes gene_type:complete